MDKKLLAMIITILAGVGCIYYFMHFEYRTDPSRSLGGAIILFCEMLVILVTGILLSLIKRTKEIGQGILLAASIVLVIGAGVCSFT